MPLRMSWLLVVLILLTPTLTPRGSQLATADEPNTKKPVQLRTEHLPTPLQFAGDKARRSITAIEILGDLSDQGDGEGTLTLDESALAFNEFGDARVVKAKPGKSTPIAFRRIKVEDKAQLHDRSASDKTRAYDIEFTDGSLAGRLRLVLADDGIGPHRLLVYNGEKPSAVLQILNLNGRPEIKEALPDVPRRGPIGLTTLSPMRPHPPAGLHAINLTGMPDGEGSLHLDLNHLMINMAGEVYGSTAMYVAPHKVTFQKLDLPDPLRQGRVLYDIVPIRGRLTNNYQLVLAPTEAGLHRLLIRDGDALSQVLPLHDPARRAYVASLAMLEGVSAEERQAIIALQKIAGYHFRFKVEGKQVTELTLDSRNDAEVIDSVLRKLSNLTNLQFHGSRLTEAGLASLGQLKKLRSIYMNSASVADRGLETFRQAPHLTSIHFYCISGITDEGLKSLGTLKELKYLRLYREDSLKPGFKGPRITDAGLAHLKDLTELESLDLMGQDITDAGLEHLKRMKKLKQLFLSGPGISDGGLDHLKALDRLERLHLYQTQTTPAGLAELKAKLPKLQISG